MTTSQDQNTEKPQLKVNYIITKHANFTTKQSPTAFSQWKPDVKVDMEINTNKSGEEKHEVALVMKITVKSGDQEAFVINLEQIGGFTLHALTEDQQNVALNTVCSSMIYPYVSEVVASMTVRGGFPALTLAPVNFDSVYALRKQKAAQLKAEKNKNGHTNSAIGPDTATDQVLH